MGKMARRGYVPTDDEQFHGEALLKLGKAKEEVCFLLDRDYPIKQVTTFVGNHYMFSERQRLALTRITSPKRSLIIRKKKQIQVEELDGKTVNVDGFNSIITLEVALSLSPILLCDDGCIRDLAGLRGTYRIIDKTQEAIHLLLQKLQEAKVKEVCFYLDQPVSNSGRLSSLIQEIAKEYKIKVITDVRCDVDTVLEGKENVVTSDAIILNRCISYVNVIAEIVKESKENLWIIQL